MSKQTTPKKQKVKKVSKGFVMTYERKLEILEQLISDLDLSAEFMIEEDKQEKNHIVAIKNELLEFIFSNYKSLVYFVSAIPDNSEDICIDDNNNKEKES